VAVAAIDSVVANVMFVAELYRLRSNDILPREVWERANPMTAVSAIPARNIAENRLNLAIKFVLR